MSKSSSWSGIVLVLGTMLASLGGWVGCNRSNAEVPETPKAAPLKPSDTAHAGGINPRLLRRFRPIAQSDHPMPVTTDEMVTLGRMLYYEPRLSRSGKISCNSCHDLANYGVDHRPTSLGERGQIGRRNAPTVYNAAEHFTQFWDGRARDVEEQATGPILNPGEMASTREEVETLLRSIPEYKERFKKAFPQSPEPVSLENVGRAIGAFERGLVTRSRWDDFLAGKADALSAAEIRGLQVFLEVGCMGCHTGPQVGASMFQVVGFVEAWPNKGDLGRFEITKVPTDRMVFKVPTLKNITRTGPYFHDGSSADLRTAIRAMGRHQLGIDLSEQEISAIAAFFGALEGELPRAYLAPPPLPLPRRKPIGS